MTSYKVHLIFNQDYATPQTISTAEAFKYSEKI